MHRHIRTQEQGKPINFTANTYIGPSFLKHCHPLQVMLGDMLGAEFAWENLSISSRGEFTKKSIKFKFRAAQLYGLIPKPCTYF